MYLDAFTLSALVDEFMDTLVGGRIQDTIDVDATGLGLEIYANRRRQYLYLSADLQMPRVHLVPDKLRRGVTKQKPINLLFRRYVEGGTVAHVSQPPWERVLVIDVDGPEGAVSIIVEPMERRSNLLLVQAGVILDCMRRVGPEDNRFRLSLPQHDYVPPPPQTGKLAPNALTIEDIFGILDQTEDQRKQVHRALSSRLLGMSPLLAKEIVYRASGSTNTRLEDIDADTLLDAIHAVVDPLTARDWQPGVVEAEDGIQAYSVYPLQSMNGWQPVETVSGALATYYGTVFGEDAYLAAKKPVRAAIEEARKKVSAKLASLERSLTDETERDVLRQSGELILAYQYMIEPDQTELRAQYDPEGPEMAIKLDPAQTPLENAQRYFSRYDKAKRALDDVPRLVEEARNDLAFLVQLDADLDLASNWPDIDDVQQALQERGYWRGKRAGRVGGGRSGPLRLVSKDGFVLWVGRNSRQNEIATFDKGGPADLWLHARDVGGAHVVIKYDGRPIPEDLIVQAAQIAAHYSASRDEANVIVDVTERRYVKKIKGAGPGMVTYRNETTRTVTPANEDILNS